MRKQDQLGHCNTNFIHTGTCQRMWRNSVFTTSKTTSEVTLVRKGLLHLKASRIPTETTSFITQIKRQKNRPSIEHIKKHSPISLPRLSLLLFWIMFDVYSKGTQLPAEEWVVLRHEGRTL